jgi:hypothetical protein
MGNLVAAEALRTSELISLSSRGLLDSATVTLSLPMKAGDELEHFLRHMSVGEEERRLLRQMGAMVAELQALRIGNAQVVAIPGEPFVDIGLRIKESFPGQNTVVVGYANGNVGYIPYRRYFGENRYESIATPLNQESVVLVEREAIALLAGLS